VRVGCLALSRLTGQHRHEVARCATDGECGSALGRILGVLAYDVGVLGRFGLGARVARVVLGTLT
jgi:hypothetical protein